MTFKKLNFYEVPSMFITFSYSFSSLLFCFVLFSPGSLLSIKYRINDRSLCFKVYIQFINQKYGQYKTDFQLASESTGNENMETLLSLPAKLKTSIKLNIIIMFICICPHPPSPSFRAFYSCLKQILPLEFRIKTPHELFSMIIDYPILIFPSQHSSLIKY